MSGVRTVWRLGSFAWRAGVGAVALVAFLVGIGVRGVAAQTPVRAIRSVPVTEKAVALTFDDGPDPVYTPQVLSVLQANGAKATFFLIGVQLLRYADLARQEAQAGMELGNHGDHHLSLVGLDPTAIQSEVLPVEREITAITGSRPVLYRLPKGRGDARGLRTLADMGYTIVY